jgi:CheY-like chemotaxis protein
MEGLEPTMALRKREADGKEHLAVICLTADVMEGDRERCLEAGMDDYVPKPLHKRELFEAWSWLELLPSRAIDLGN